MPEPRAVQLLPFQATMLLAGTPPAMVKLPPMKVVVPLMATAEVRAARRNREQHGR